MRLLDDDWLELLLLFRLLESELEDEDWLDELELFNDELSLLLDELKLLLDEEFRLLESDDSELLLESSSMSPSYRPVGVPVSPKRVSGIGHQTMMNVSLFAGASVMAGTVK